MSHAAPTPPAGIRMLALAAGAAALMKGEAVDGLRGFVRSRRTPDGGFRGRAATSDLYYATFGLALARLLDEPPSPSELAWLDRFGEGAALDLVHRASLIRCRALTDALPDPKPWRTGLAAFRSADGEWMSAPGGPLGGPYAAFIALLATEDLGGAEAGDLDATARAVLRCRDADGGFGGAPGAPPTTAVTAAAVVVLQTAGHAVPDATLDWLAARRSAAGGWFAAPGAPVPDLLSAAVASAALRIAGRHVTGPPDADVEFIERHAREDGGFASHPDDPSADVEYTWYALLALGALFAP
jgi:prenyltransferase beta subunit